MKLGNILVCEAELEEGVLSLDLLVQVCSSQSSLVAGLNSGIVLDTELPLSI